MPAHPTPATRRERPSSGRQLSAFRELTDHIHALGLMRRRYGFYWTAFALCILATASIWTATLLLADGWSHLLLAAGMGLILAQLGFLGHEACHRQVFVSARRNEWAGRLISGLLLGLSYGWWMNKHSRHHATPNQLGKDPDIDSAAVAFTADAARRRRGAGRLLLRWQSWAFIPLLSLEGFSLHVSSVRRLLDPAPMKHRGLEAALLTTRLVGYPAAVFCVLPPSEAAAFLLVQTAVFGFLLGGAFAPNHIGMPVVDRTSSVDFLRRQVLMSRNIRGGALTRFLLGGLDTQIEHHLFPNMPRPNLQLARAHVRAYCQTHGIRYTETTLRGAYQSVLAHLSQIGLSARRQTFTCPITERYRR